MGARLRNLFTSLLVLTFLALVEILSGPLLGTEVNAVLEFFFLFNLVYHSLCLIVQSLELRLLRERRSRVTSNILKIYVVGEGRYQRLKRSWYKQA